MEIFVTKSLIFIGFSQFGTEFLCSGLALGRTEPNFQVQVRAKAEPNIRFRFRFSAKSAKPGLNRTVASLNQRLLQHLQHHWHQYPLHLQHLLCLHVNGHLSPQNCFTLSLDLHSPSHVFQPQVPALYREIQHAQHLKDDLSSWKNVSCSSSPRLLLNNILMCLTMSVLLRALLTAMHSGSRLPTTYLVGCVLCN